MTEGLEVGVGVFIMRNNKILLLKRKGTYGRGTWATPGGHLEFKESFEECAKREVREEVGIKIKNQLFLAVTNDVLEEEGKQCIAIFMKSEDFEGEPENKEPERCEELGWFSWEHLPEPLFEPVKSFKERGFNPFD